MQLAMGMAPMNLYSKFSGVSRKPNRITDASPEKLAASQAKQARKRKARLHAHNRATSCNRLPQR